MYQQMSYPSMQSSQQQGNSVLFQPIQDSNLYCFPHNNYPSLNHHHQYMCSDQQTYQSSGLDSSSSVYNSPSTTLSFSTNGSTTIQESHSCPLGGTIATPLTDHQPLCDDITDINCDYFLDNLDIFEGQNQEDPSEKQRWKHVMEVISRRELKEMMITCAESIADNRLFISDLLIAELKTMVSVYGDPIQRLCAYMLEGLIARLDLTGNCIYRSLKCNIPTGPKLLSYMQILYEACPYYKFAYAAANSAILEAIHQAPRIHIIDFQIAQGSQWIPIIQTLSNRPNGPPRLRITGVDDAQSAYARNGGLEIVGGRLANLAKTHNIPFEFHSAAMSGNEVDLNKLKLRDNNNNNEAIVVNFPYVLHHMPDESVGVENHRDRLIRLVRGLDPKIVTLVEQESNTNTTPLVARFKEAMSFYTAMFESVEAAMPGRESRERVSVEMNCLARDVVSIVGCEGEERVERHEVLGKWRVRFGMAGFRGWGLSGEVRGCVERLLERYSEEYRVEEIDGALVLGWKDRRLFTCSAWKC